ncbi:MAG TPA: alpha-amylase family glycosyl hydrolase [Candidatus Binataceae bacterium]|nr:alpha-amylase family glycosyl hydrolase [Candidatus Binataceae bacterium]
MNLEEVKIGKANAANSPAIDVSEVGTFASATLNGFQIKFGVYLPGVRGADGFKLTVKVIHADDRFDPQVATTDLAMHWNAGHPLDLWSGTMAVAPAGGGHFGSKGLYLYRFQLAWGADDQIVTNWFTDPFAMETDVGSLSAVTLAKNASVFNWTDANYKTPELDDLIVYELEAEQFNGGFDGVVDRLTYLQSLGVNCIELMPVTSPKLDFDWGYGPLHYFAPSRHIGGTDGLKRLVDACHQRGIAVILDVVD